MEKYRALFWNYFNSELEYRVNMIGYIVIELISTSSILLLWISVYRDNNSIAGYSLKQALFYYLLIPTIGLFTQAYVSSNIAPEIRLGTFSRYLLKPHNVWLLAFIQSITGKINQIILILPVTTVILAIYFTVFNDVSISLFSLLIALVVVVFAYVLNFFLDLAITWTAFWFDDVWCFQHFKSIIFSVLGGASFPFDFLPSAWQTIFNFLPFKYLYYVPVSYITGKRNPSLIIIDIFQIIIWTGLFYLIALFLWRKGNKKYGAYGN